MSTDIKAGLQAIKNQNSEAYTHLKKLIADVASGQHGLQSFEEQSFSCRAKDKAEVVFKVREAFSHLKDFEASNRALLGKINTGTPQEPQEPASLTFVPDFMEESQMFAKLGIGFGEDQSYRIFKSIAALSVKKNTKQLKFWGKIIGRDCDYYIAEGMADGGEEAGQLAPDTEPKGTGVNKLNYWATTCLSGEWTELPLLTPEHIRSSRKIKYIFTGDLKKLILTNPIFNGTEAHLLKCQIVRITSSCSIVPKGVYSKNAEDPNSTEIQLAGENYSFPSVQDMAGKESWQYFSPCILKNGRTTHLKPQGMEEEEAEKQMKKIAEKDPVEARLKSVAMDSQNWAIKCVGLEDKYKSIGKNPKIVCKGVVGVKNLVWPGWTTVGYEGKYSSIYIGYGHKFQQYYYPREPQQVLQECEDREQMNSPE